MTDIDAVLRGAIDMHIHAGPDTLPCHVDTVESAEQARQSGMRVIVIKNISGKTSRLAMKKYSG